MKNPFFKKKNNVEINDILKCIGQKKSKNNSKVNDISDLESASKNDISFFHTRKYLEKIKNTKSRLVITNQKLKNIVPKNIRIILVSNVLLTTAKVTSLFYPDALDDIFDDDVFPINKKKFKSIKFGNNVLLGKNVKIGKN